MAEVTHRIKRQIFELSAPALPLARRIQDEASRMQSRRIVPILERVCHGASAPDTLHRMDLVDVDLGEIPAGDFENSFCERLEIALRRALAERIEADETLGRDAGPPRIRSALELFVYFAKNGSLPWWADTRAPRLLDENAHVLLREARDELANVIEELSLEPVALQRITLTYDDAVLAEICALFVAEPAARALTALPPSLIEVARVGKLSGGVPVSRLRSLAWLCVLHAALRSRNGATAVGTNEEKARALCEEALVEMAASTRIPYRELNAHGIAEMRDTQAEAETETETVDAAKTVAAAETETVLGAKSELGVDVDAKLGTPTRSRPRRGGAKPQARRAVTSASGEFDLFFNAPDEIYVHDAGLCILWPFLLGFFESLGLAPERTFKDEPARHRAARLLGHIATGKPETDEFLLPLPKILCGMEPEAVIEPDDPLTEREMEACADFLTAVIAQAPILNDMSNNFFRHSFILRDGVLSSQDGSFLLRVERETYDIILDQLPWGFDWAALPFMEAPLRVEWR